MQTVARTRHRNQPIYGVKRHDIQLQRFTTNTSSKQISQTLTHILLSRKRKAAETPPAIPDVFHASAATQLLATPVSPSTTTYTAIGAAVIVIVAVATALVIRSRK